MFKLIIAGLGWWGKVMIQRLSSSKKVKIVNLIEPYPDKEALQLAENFNLDISHDFEPVSYTHLTLPTNHPV